MGLKLGFIKSKTIFGLKRNKLKLFYAKDKLQNHRDLNDKNHRKTLKSIFFSPAAITTKPIRYSLFPPVSDASPTLSHRHYVTRNPPNPRALQLLATARAPCIVGGRWNFRPSLFWSDIRDYTPVTYKFPTPIFGLQIFYNSKINLEGNMVIKNHPSCYRSKQKIH